METTIENPRESHPLLKWLHLDPVLLLGLLALSGLGLVVLYSAAGQDEGALIRQLVRLGVAFGVMFVLAQIPPRNLTQWTPWLFAGGVGLLLAVWGFGVSGKGAQRWLDLGVIRFQPSELMKLLVPMMVAWFLAQRPLPPSLWRVAGAAAFIAVPMVLIVLQPDLGTALLVGSAGFFALFVGGIAWRLLFLLAGLAAAAAPLAWHFLLHDYQRQRVLTFLNPENDPLGAGYHIIQSKIAIGSGGMFGKGWLNGTQSHLDFLPERSTDFIFAVYGEEFGWLGILALLAVYLFIVLRGLYIATQASDAWSRMVGAALSLTFFVYLFVNTGMVTGLLPVVGVPLPLISYGGTSMVTLMAGFGILMSIHTHRRFLLVR